MRSQNRQSAGRGLRHAYVHFDLVSSLGPLDDEPLTLMVAVPGDWNTCAASQGSVVKPCTIGGSRVLVDVVPNQGRILFVKGG